MCESLGIARKVLSLLCNAFPDHAGKTGSKSSTTLLPLSTPSVAYTVLNGVPVIDDIRDIAAHRKVLSARPLVVSTGHRYNYRVVSFSPFAGIAPYI